MRRGCFPCRSCYHQGAKNGKALRFRCRLVVCPDKIIGGDLVTRLTPSPAFLYFATGLGIFQDFAKEDLGDLLAGHVAQLS